MVCKRVFDYEYDLFRCTKLGKTRSIKRGCWRVRVNEIASSSNRTWIENVRDCPLINLQFVLLSDTSADNANKQSVAENYLPIFTVVFTWRDVPHWIGRISFFVFFWEQLLDCKFHDLYNYGTKQLIKANWFPSCRAYPLWIELYNFNINAWKYNKSRG